MKNLILPLFFAIILFSFVPNKSQSDYHVFPIGTKFTIQLIDNKDGSYDIKVLEEKRIKYKIDYSKTDGIFSDKPKPGTIEGIFAKGVSQKGSFKSVLILRNNTKNVLDYSADISLNRSGKFYSTSVSMLFPGAISSELWKNKLRGIVLHDFIINGKWKD